MRTQVRDTRCTQHSHHAIGLFAQDSKGAVDALLTAGRQSIKRGTPQQHATGPQCECLDDVGSAAEPAVHQHGHVSCSLHDLWQNIQSRGSVVQGPPSVVGHHDTIQSV